MQMMEQTGQVPGQSQLDQIAKEQTLELNASHPIVVNLNSLRKSNKAAASLVARQFLDNVFVSSGIPYDIAAGADRQYRLLSSYLDVMVNQGDDSGAKRATE